MSGGRLGVAVQHDRLVQVPADALEGGPVGIEEIGGPQRGDHDQGVDLGILGDHGQDARRPELRGAGDVDRIGGRREGRQNLAEPLLGRRGQLGNEQAGVAAGVGHPDARTARVADDGRAPARPSPAPGQGHGDIEHLLGVMDAHDAIAAEHGVIRPVLAGEMTGVGEGGPLGGIRPADLGDHEVLAEPDRPRRHGGQRAGSRRPSM